MAVVDFPPDHIRRPINDDEIVACGDQLAAATGKKVTLVSSDSSGLSFELDWPAKRSSQPAFRSSRQTSKPGRSRSSGVSRPIRRGIGRS